MTWNLEMIREAINENTFIEVKVKEVWIDYGAGWKENTIVSIYPKEYQVLNPFQVEDANKGVMSTEQMQEIIDRINKRGW